MLFRSNALKVLNERNLNFYMHYIGPISEEKLNQLDLSEISDKIKFYGRMDSKQGFAISQRCFVGLSVLKPIQNYILSYSTKIFEYMAIGMPVITSNFPLYKEVVEKYECGFCIDPYSPKDLADAIEFLFFNPTSAQVMGLKGRQKILEKFNWSAEEENLLNIYSNIENSRKK